MDTARARTAADGLPRVLLIGLDSADAELIERWSAEGDLPTLTGLRRDGVWGRLRTTAEVMHVSAWPTLYTGALPGEHGMYHAYQMRAGDQRVHRTRPEWCALPPFWKYLDDAGRRCLIMDAFMDYPLDGFKGVQILEYGTWTWFTDPGARPRRTWKELIRRFGPYPAPEHTQVPETPDPGHFRDRLIAGAEVKGRAARWLLQTQDWDFAFVTFGEPHGAGHYLWHVGDPSYPAYPPGGLAGLEDPVRDVYRAVDAALATVLEATDDRTMVIVTSGDGMGPNYAGCHLMPDFLHRLGLFDAAGVGVEAVGEGGSRKPGILSRLRGAIPLSVRHAVSRCLPRELHYRMQMKWVNSGIDWERSRVFCIPNANEGYFRVNLKGREPRGNVESGDQCAELLADVAARVRELVVPETGRAAVECTWLTDDVFPGSQRGHLPDLVATWDAEARTLAELRSERVGTIRKVPPFRTSPHYTGNHRPNAFVVARGVDISPGSSLQDGHIVDLAPTVLARLGVSPPAHVGGRVWGEMAGK